MYCIPTQINCWTLNYPTFILRYQACSDGGRGTSIQWRTNRVACCFQNRRCCHSCSCQGYALNCNENVCSTCSCKHVKSFHFVKHYIANEFWRAILHYCSCVVMQACIVVWNNYFKIPYLIDT